MTAARTEVSDCAAGASLVAGQRVVVKIGSSLLVDSDGHVLREKWLEEFAADAARLSRRGQDLVVVSSGAIALGRGALSYGNRDLALEESQAAAAAGQVKLAQSYASVLAQHGITVAQVLLTLGDTQNRRRYLNARTTLKTLLAAKSVPVVNENDTVATDEIRYGDNDRLAARVALMVGADVLVLLTDVDGLHTADPRSNPDALRIDSVREITQAMLESSRTAGSSDASGGMHTKLLAAQMAMQGGCMTLVARGDVPRPLEALEQGADCTRFLPAATPKAARKQWIAAMKTVGALRIDAGAERALKDGRSLLAVGLARVEGEFDRGDAVSICGPSGETLGAGLVAYSADEARRVAGISTSQVSTALGYPGRGELVHRDDLVLWERL